MSSRQPMSLKAQEIVVVLYGAAPKLGWEPDSNQLSLLLRRISATNNVRRIVINTCGSCSALSSGKVKIPSETEVKWVSEEDYAGDAGCLRGILAGHKQDLAVVLPMGLIACPPVDELVKMHVRGGACLTFFKDSNWKPTGQHCGVFVLDSSLVNFIPEDGYWDIKENLIPELAVLCKKVSEVVTASPIDCFNGVCERGEKIAAFQELIINNYEGLSRIQSWEQGEVWCTGSENIDESVRVYGTVVMLEDVSVSAGALLVGPAILARGVKIGKESMVLTGYVKDSIGDYSIWEGDEKVSEDSNERRSHLPHAKWMKSMSSLQPAWIVAVATLTAVWLWSFKPALQEIWGIWMRSDEYSSGLLVPLLGGYVLWTRRRQIEDVEIKPAPVLGSIAFLVAFSAQFFGLFYMYRSAELLAIILSIWALVLWLAGKKMLLQTAGVLLFLLMMLPLPGRVQSTITLPLQKWSTDSAVFCLEMLGYPVVQEGNIIQIGDTRVAVAEACNGLRMITAFFVIGALVALLAKRAWWEKVIILASCLPIALVCNTVRLAVTAIAFTRLSGERWQQLFHDFGGYAMMPLALGLVILQLYLLERLFVRDNVVERIVVKRSPEARGSSS